MPKASEHPSGLFTKMLMAGESGSGKTGALISLLVAGYKVHVIDLDAGLDFLMHELRKRHPEVLDNLDYVTCTDKLKPSPAGGLIPVGIPTAYTKAVGLMDKWEDGTKPSEWGKDHVLVVDSLSFLGNAAFRWKEALNPGAKDPRQVFYSAQDAVEDVLGLLTSEQMHTNVIVTSHVRWMERQDGSVKAFPSAIGGALSPKIPTYFNSLVLAETVGVGNSVKRQIRTAPTIFMDLKNPAGKDLSEPLPIETGLATFLQKVQE